jgi:hypothetical protein
LPAADAPGVERTRELRFGAAGKDDRFAVAARCKFGIEEDDDPSEPAHDPSFTVLSAGMVPEFQRLELKASSASSSR